MCSLAISARRHHDGLSAMSVTFTASRRTQLTNAATSWDATHHGDYRTLIASQQLEGTTKAHLQTSQSKRLLTCARFSYSILIQSIPSQDEQAGSQLCSKHELLRLLVHPSKSSVFCNAVCAFATAAAHAPRYVHSHISNVLIRAAICLHHVIGPLQVFGRNGCS